MLITDWKGTPTIAIEPGETIHIGIIGVGAHIEYRTSPVEDGEVTVAIDDLFNEETIDVNTFTILDTDNEKV